MLKRTTWTSLLLLSLVSLALSQGNEKLSSSEGNGDVEADAITIKLDPAGKRKKGDVRTVVERLRTVPELQGASIAAASRDLIVLIPGATHTHEQLKLLLLQQPEVYELEVGEQLFRREGDKSYDQVRKEKLAEALSKTKTKIQQKLKDKLWSMLQGRGKKRGGDSTTGGGAAQGPQEKEARKKMAGKAVKRAVKRARRRTKRLAEKSAAEL